MYFAVTDTETTGLSNTDQVVEIAVVLIDGKKPADRKRWKIWSSFVKPGVPVTVGARAVHHITDAELEGADTMAKLVSCPQLQALNKENVVTVAHNLKFDKRLLAQSGFELQNPTICTYQCARHLVEADSYANQFLRYHLDLNIMECPLPPHRALADALVTAQLLVHLLELQPAEELLSLSNKFALLRTCSIGKFRGRKWAEIKDENWLEWVSNKGGPQGFSEDVCTTAGYWAKQLKLTR